MGVTNGKDREVLKKKIKDMKTAIEKERKQLEKERKVKEKEQRRQQKKKWTALAKDRRMTLDWIFIFQVYIATFINETMYIKFYSYMEWYFSLRLDMNHYGSIHLSHHKPSSNIYIIYIIYISSSSMYRNRERKTVKLYIFYLFSLGLSCLLVLSIKLYMQILNVKNIKF